VGFRFGAKDVQGGLIGTVAQLIDRPLVHAGLGADEARQIERIGGHARNADLAWWSPRSPWPGFDLVLAFWRASSDNEWPSPSRRM
jgi:hypothetical protein